MNITKHEELPDFQDLDDLVEEIKTLTIQSELLDIYIKGKEAAILSEYASNPARFVSGKALPIGQLKSTVVYTGENNELIKEREKLAELTANLAAAKLRFNVERSKIDVWRTTSANERYALSTGDGYSLA